MTARSLGCVDTVYSADCIEFSPVNPTIFVCGTYQLQKVEEKQNDSNGDAENAADDESQAAAASPVTRRVGRALVYEVTGGGDSL